MSRLRDSDGTTFIQNVRFCIIVFFSRQELLFNSSIHIWTGVGVVALLSSVGMSFNVGT